MKRAGSILRFIPAFLWMTVIYLFSDAPAAISTDQSMTVTGRLLGFVGRFITIDVYTQAYLIVLLEPFIRKAAHMTEYAILFFFVMLSSGVFIKDRGRRILVSWGICLLYAASDEFHQTFVSGRAGMVKDVVIDMLGVMLASLIYLLFVKAGSGHSSNFAFIKLKKTD